MRKIIKKLLAATITGSILLSGCGTESNGNISESKESTPAQETVQAEKQEEKAKGGNGKTIVNFYYWDEAQKEGMDELINMFEASQDNIIVEPTIVPWGEYWTKLQTALPTGTGPDVFWMNIGAPDYIEPGLLLDMTERIQEAGIDMSKFPEAVTGMYEQDGKIYGIPKDYDGMAVYYNKSIFDEMGVEYPKEGWTWDDLLATAQALTNDTHYGIVANPDSNTGYQNYVYQNGGFMMDENKMPTVNAKPVVEALQFMHDMMYKYKVSPTGAEQLEFGYSDMFISGQTAMITDESWNVNKYAEALGADFQIAELPQHVSRGATTHGLAYVIAANSSNTDAAWEFVKFAATKEAQEVTAKSAIPAYEGAADVWKTLYPDQNVEILLESVSYASPNPRYAENSTEAAQILTDTISSIWLDENADIQGMLDEAQQKMTEVINAE